MKHAILTSLGTDGDVYPFLHLGLELQRRGIKVTLATHEHFRNAASQGGLQFQSVVSDRETQELLEQQAFWHPLRGPLVVARWGARLFKRQYEILKQLSSEANSFLLASPGMLAARVLQEERGTPLVSVVLQPWIIASLSAPPVMMGGLTLPRWTPRPILKIYFRLINALGARVVGPDVNRLRSALGLPPVRNMFYHWWFSPQLVLGLFPEWFGQPQSDWPKQIRLVGFPQPRSAGRDLPQGLTRFCQNSPVIAFTFGTGMMHARTLFEQAIEACRCLGVRAVFVTRFGAQLPGELPPFIHHCAFATFEALFPLCAAVVHHGGIGTTAAALAAGRPQLIIPFAFDQMDNALRVERLGSGAWLRRNQKNHRGLTASLTRLLKPEFAEATRRLAERFKGIDGIEAAADHIEALVNKPGASVAPSCF